MAIVYGSMKLTGCQKRQPTHRHRTSLEVVATLVGVAQYQGVHEQCALKLIWNTCARERQAIAVAQYIGLMKVDLIHKVAHNNMVRNTLSEQEEFQAMSIIQIIVANVCR
jgi:hypothetical protein